VLGVLSSLPLWFLPEPEGRDAGKQGVLLDYFRVLFRVIRNEANYRNFLWGRALVGLAHMSDGFFAVYALQRFALPAQVAPLFMVPSLIGQGVGSVMWGYLGDKKGNRAVQLGLCAQYALALCIALVAPNPWVFLFAFLFNGMAFAGDFVSTTNFLLESAPDHDLMGYVGFANSLISPIFALSSVLGGAIADATSFPVLFGVNVAVWACALLVMALVVVDPRKLKASPHEATSKA